MPSGRRNTLAFAVWQVGEGGADARMQRHAAGFVVLGSAAIARVDREGDVAAGEIDIVPIEPQCLADARAGVEQEDHQRAQVFVAGGDRRSASSGVIQRMRPGGFFGRSIMICEHHPRLAACFMTAEVGV